MVPNASAPWAASDCAPLTWSSNQRTLVPEKYGSITRPVERRNCSAYPARARNCAHSGSVRRSCQTIAWWIGAPLARRHSSVVSRWLVMPSAAMSAAFRAALASASRATASCVSQISLASCSTQPGLRIDLAELALRHRDDASAGMEHDRARARRALVECQQVLLGHRVS
jgi:hypothetical protein